MSESIRLAVTEKIQPGHLDEMLLMVNHSCYFSLLELNSDGEPPELRYVKIGDEEIEGPHGQALEAGDLITVGVYTGSNRDFQVEVIATLIKAMPTEPPSEEGEVTHVDAAPDEWFMAMEPGDAAQLVVSHPEYDIIMRLLTEFEERRKAKRQPFDAQAESD